MIKFLLTIGVIYCIFFKDNNNYEEEKIKNIVKQEEKIVVDKQNNRKEKEYLTVLENTICINNDCEVRVNHNNKIYTFYTQGQNSIRLMRTKKMNQSTNKKTMVIIKCDSQKCWISNAF
jgi:hypothetical protein